jgi:putative MATE family efflux protein
VETLLGDPKKAIRRLAIPMIIAMAVQVLYNFFDGVWVAGIGPEALAAVGFFFPFFMLIMGVAMGVGMGGGAAISRRIGANDKAGADRVAVTTMILMFIMTVAFTIPALIFAEDIFRLMGADDSLSYAVAYAKVMFGGILFIFFANIANTILRAEGDAKRAMIAMMLGAALNIILDPIFIYGPNNPGPWFIAWFTGSFGLDLGVAGAAYATVLSMLLSSMLIVFWLFIKKDTYISFKLKGFRFEADILKDIFKVGIPAMIMHMSMAIMMLFENIIVVNVGGEDGVAVLTAGWRMLMIAVLPTMGVATAVVSVGGASFGAKRYDKLSTAYVYAIKLAFIGELVIAAVIFIGAPIIHIPFTWGEGSARLTDDLIMFMRIMVFFFPAIAFGMLSSSMFQGIGKGMNALVVTILRTLIFILPFAFLYGVVLDWGLNGVWIGKEPGQGKTIAGGQVYRQVLQRAQQGLYQIEQPVHNPKGEHGHRYSRDAVYGVMLFYEHRGDHHSQAHQSHHGPLGSPGKQGGKQWKRGIRAVHRGDTVRGGVVLLLEQ